MTKVPSLPYHKIIAALERDGWIVVRQRGSHIRLLSDIFDEPVDKRNLKSVLERQGNVNISLGDNSINSNVINCIKFGYKNPQNKSDKNNSIHPKFKHRKNNKIHLEKIDKLRYFGLSDEQIAEVLDLPLEVVKQVE